MDRRDANAAVVDAIAAGVRHCTDSYFATPGNIRGRVFRRFRERIDVFEKALRQGFRADLSISAHRVPALDDKLIRRAEAEAAGLRGAAWAALTTQGCTSANHMALRALLFDGARVVVFQGAHKSIDGELALAQQQGLKLRLRFAPCGYDPASETFIPPPSGRLAAIAELAVADVVVATFPSYAGRTPAAPGSWLAALRRAAPKARVMIDAAWGSHFGFCPGTEQLFAAAAPDVATFSDHKTAFCREQCATLACWSNDRELRWRLKLAVRAYRTTSPSFPLVAAWAASNHGLLRHGPEIYAVAVAMRQRLEGLLARHDLEFVRSDDPLKLFVRTAPLGFSGREFARRLDADENVVVEMGTEDGVLLVVSPGLPELAIDELPEQIMHIVRNRKPRRAPLADLPVPPLPEMADDLPLDLLRQAPRHRPLARAVGKIAADFVYVYPPGIPLLRPGQVIRPQDVATLSGYLERQVEVKGLRGDDLVPLWSLKRTVPRPAPAGPPG